MTAKLDLTKPLETCSGLRARIISTDGNDPYVLVGYVGSLDYPHTWKADGGYSELDANSPLNLRNVKEETPISRDDEIGYYTALGLLKGRPPTLDRASGAVAAMAPILFAYRHGGDAPDIKKIWVAVVEILDLLGMPVDLRERIARRAATEIAWRYGIAPEQVGRRRSGRDFDRTLGGCWDEEMGGGNG